MDAVVIHENLKQRFGEKVGDVTVDAPLRRRVTSPQRPGRGRGGGDLGGIKLSR